MDRLTPLYKADADRRAAEAAELAAKRAAEELEAEAERIAAEAALDKLAFEGAMASAKRIAKASTTPTNTRRTRTLTQERHDFCDIFFGVEGTQERIDFLVQMRRQFFAGTLAPNVFVQMMQYRFGRVKESIELKVQPVDYEGLTDAQLAARARRVAELVAASSTIDVLPELERMNEESDLSASTH